jgi:hypothetical protein
MLSRATFKLQYVSKLFPFARAGKPPAVLPGANALALLGNCGSTATAEDQEATAKFINRCAKAWPRVFWVPGPTEVGGPLEHYQHMQLCSDIAAAAAPGGRVVMMNQGEVHDQQRDIVFLGAGGWVPTGVVPPLAGATAPWHEEDILWLRERVDWWSTHRPAVRIVIMTHHLCSPLLAGSEPNPLEIMPQGTLNKVVPLGVASAYAWLCGAGSKPVTGFLRGRQQSPPAQPLFGATNPGNGLRLALYI